MAYSWDLLHIKTIIWKSTWQKHNMLFINFNEKNLERSNQTIPEEAWLEDGFLLPLAPRPWFSDVNLDSGTLLFELCNDRNKDH